MKNYRNIISSIKNKMSKKEVNGEEDLQENVASQTETTENEASEPEIAAPELTEAEKLAIEVAELKDKYLRLYSEFDNFRKRTAKEKIDLIQTASEGVIVDLLSVVDDFERAKANAKEGEISDGIELIFNKLTSTLQNKGLVEMNAKGEVFNADLHDCITQFPAPTEAEKGKVVEVVEKGYLLKEKVIRFAKVVVGN
jgi:molecular chaperone GrpE